MAVKKRSIGKTIMGSALVLFGGFLIISSSIYIYLSPKLPSIEESLNFTMKRFKLSQSESSKKSKKGGAITYI